MIDGRETGLRIYYNRMNEYPFVASVDQGSLETEVKLQSILCHATTGSFVDPDAPEGSPRFWLGCYGVLRVLAEHGVITRD